MAGARWVFRAVDKNIHGPISLLLYPANFQAGWVGHVTGQRQGFASQSLNSFAGGVTKIFAASAGNNLAPAWGESFRQGASNAEVPPITTAVSM